MEALIQDSSTEEARRTASILKKNYSYPVDSILVAKDFSVLGEYAANDMFQASGALSYDSFLTKALDRLGKGKSENGH